MEDHTGGSLSIPTVHPCSQSGRRLWVARKALHLHEPIHEGNGRSIHNSFCFFFFSRVFLFSGFFFSRVFTGGQSGRSNKGPCTLGFRVQGFRALHGCVARLGGCEWPSGGGCGEREEGERGRRCRTTPSRAPCRADVTTPLHPHYLLLGFGVLFLDVDVALRNVVERAEEVRHESSESCDFS